MNSKRKTIAIIGHGYVGKAYEELLKDHYDLVIKTTKKKPSYKEINKCDLKIICVPTPMKEDGSCDIDIVMDVACKLKGLVLIKSTVPPGTTNRLNICDLHLNGNQTTFFVFSPEYVGEGNYYVPPEYMHPTNIKQHPFIIVGGLEPACQEVIQFFLPVMGPACKYHITDSTTAEMVKYMDNCWGAAKVTFANEWYDISEAFGVSYEKLRELWLLDKRNGPMHTAVFRDKRGFGGKCYPKDVNGIVQASIEQDYFPELLISILSVNKKMRGKNL